MSKKKELIDSLAEEGVLKTKEIIKAFKKVHREEFVLPQYRKYAYVDEPLPLMKGQTISQPYTIAVMTEALEPKKGQKILEIGAGSGYQAAILAQIVGKDGRIITIERIKELADFAAGNLKKCGYSNIVIVEGDGTEGYEKSAPYDRIIVTARAPEIPAPLLRQLKVGGIMVITVEDQLYAVKKTSKTKIEKTFLGYYAFVPLIGKYGYRE